jgi:hypothetical protein
MEKVVYVEDEELFDGCHLIAELALDTARAITLLFLLLQTSSKFEVGVKGRRRRRGRRLLGGRGWVASSMTATGCRFFLL